MDLPIDLTGLKSDLRGYQEVGVKWLWFLYNHGLSGLLCDEMGLGKTHQAMGLIAAAKNRQRGKKYLVVCPTSVVYHWEELLKRFLPDVNVFVFYGVSRRLEAFKEEDEVLLTSYGTLRSEKKALSKIEFDVAIFDEIQTAKNSHSQTHKALKMVKAKMRVGLTGTPIENRLLELKALFDVVVPGDTPTEAHFKELFVNPIEKNQDPEKKHCCPGSSATLSCGAKSQRSCLSCRKNRELLIAIFLKSRPSCIGNLISKRNPFFKTLKIRASLFLICTSSPFFQRLSKSATTLA